MKEITAYCPTAQIPALTKEHLQTFDRVNLAFAILENGSLSFSQLTNISYVPQIKKANPKIKVCMSVGGAGAAGFSTMAMTSQGREKFAQECLQAIIEYDLDGMDLDWEFPCSIYEGMDSSPQDKENFTYLLATLRKTFDHWSEVNKAKHLELSVAAGVGQWFINQTEVAKFTQYLDRVFLMTYDLRGFGQKYTGHHTALYDRQDDIFPSSVNSGVSSWLKLGVEAEKIHIGAAFYSRQWFEVKNENNGIVQPGEGGDFGANYDVIRDKYVNKNGFVRYWDAEAKVPWLFNGEQFITYDDPLSVQYKCNYVVDNNLGGIFFWRYLDDPDNDLIPVMADVIHKEP